MTDPARSPTSLAWRLALTAVLLRLAYAAIVQAYTMFGLPHGDRRADHVGRHAPLAGAQQHDGGRRAPQAVRHLHRPDAGLYAGRGRRDGLPAQRADAVRHEQP
ncbi:hypothetical protein G6F59_018264 [Rhizopus arrhizus]|nr:hypothetical protein G6F59_018264 [Rhizopus arrhizus]